MFRAQKELERVIATKNHIGVTYLTLAEAYTLVLRRLGVEYGHQWIQQIMEGAILINPEPGDYVHATTLVFNFQDRSITLFDAVVATLSERLRSAVWPYDRVFELMGVKRWT